MRTLYLSYFGLREPLVQTQVLPYLRELRRDGVEVHLLTFEPDRRRSWTPEAIDHWRERLAEDEIRWTALSYHKWPSLPATVYDIAVGAWVAARLVRRERIDVLHGRALIAAAMGALARWATGARLIFDIRGFLAEEYVDARRWRRGGLKYCLTKAAERAVLDVADGFVVLTERAREILFPSRIEADDRGRPIEVIPCCVDLDRFAAAEPVHRERVRRAMGLEGRRVVVYVGALGGWYLTEEMAEFLAVAHRQDPSTFALILSQSPPETLAARLRSEGLADRDYLIRTVPPDEVPHYLNAADLAFSFVKPCSSKLSSSPTKIAEYLASGLPVVSSAGIGDVDEVIETDRVGILVDGLDAAGYERALRELEELRREEGLSERCRASARRRFDLEGVGGERYRRLYRRLLERSSRGATPIGTT